MRVGGLTMLGARGDDDGRGVARTFEGFSSKL